MNRTAALQTEYSLWTREPEDELLGVCVELGIAFVAYSPLGRGFLTGSIVSRDVLAATDVRRMHPRFADENLQSNLRLLEAVRELAEARSCTPAQIALAWLLGRGVFAIPGTRSVARLEENAAAADIVLSDAERVRLDAALPPGAAAGTRYPAPAMQALNR